MALYMSARRQNHSEVFASVQADVARSLALRFVSGNGCYSCWQQMGLSLR